MACVCLSTQPPLVWVQDQTICLHKIEHRRVLDNVSMTRSRPWTYVLVSVCPPSNRLSVGGVVGPAASAVRLRRSSPQPLPPAPPGVSQGASRPAKNYNLTRLSLVLPWGSPPRWTSLKHLPREMSSRKT